jgi:hypothetical protein
MRKEVSLVKYTKPEVTVSATAIASIQSAGKGINPHPDNPMDVTVSAYEADE